MNAEKTILIVDDDTDDAAFLKHVLSKAGRGEPGDGGQ
jgi:CheY-like chemotaxis protein